MVAKTKAVEENFPRGKSQAGKTDAPASFKKVEKPVKEKDLFSVKETSGKSVDKKKDKKKPKKGSGKDGGSIFDVKSVTTVSYSQLAEGMVMLGYISDVQDFELRVSLPGRLVGIIPITNVSTPYTSALKEAASNPDSDGVDLTPLTSMYEVGQCVVVAVVSVTKEVNRYRVVLTMDPAVTMGGRIPQQGELCIAAVSSQEDHGYIMDIGSMTVRGFLPNKAATKTGQNIKTGATLICTVTRKDAGVLTLACSPAKVGVATVVTPSVHNLLPGVRINAKVEKTLDNGIKVSLGSGLSGYVHRDQLKSPIDHPDSYDVGSDLSVRVLYILPTINTILLTARDTKLTGKVQELFPEVSPGLVVRDATVVAVSKTSVTVQLNKQVLGVVAARHLSEGKEVGKNVKKKFPVGSVHSARVLGLDWSGGVAVCSLQKTLLAGVLRLDELTIGQRLTTTVKQFVKHGLLVDVGPHLTGLVPWMFLTDVPLKHPERKFFPGDKLLCRVLRVNVDKKQLHLTSKPILLNEEFDLVGSFEEAVVGKVTEGVVVKISNDGLLLQLWGDLRGFAPRSQLSTEPIEFPEKLFFLGQALKCQLTHVDEDQGRIQLSLVLKTMNPLGQRQRKAGSCLTLGSLYSAKVIDTKDTGVDVVVDCEGKTVSCLIPTPHLTDHASLASILLASVQPGDILQALCFQQDVCPILTMKQSIIKAEKNKSLPSSYSDMEVGQLIPGVVQTMKSYGAFIRLACWNFNKTALVPTRYLADFFIDNPSAVLDVGQTLVCKVMEKKDEDQKVTVATRVKELGVNVLDSVEVMVGWLKEVRRLKQLKEDVRVGSMVTGVVTNCSEFGTMTDVEGIPGVITNSQMGGMKVCVGQRVSCVVLYVDHANRVLELSCDAALVSKVTRGTKGKAKVGLTMKGSVVFSRTEHSYQLVCVNSPGYLAGLLAYLPTRAHINDLAGESDDNVSVSVVVKEVTEEGEVVVVKERSERKGEKKLKRQRGISISEDMAKKARTASESEAKETAEDIAGIDEGSEEKPVEESEAMETEVVDKEVVDDPVIDIETEVTFKKDKKKKKLKEKDIAENKPVNEEKEVEEPKAKKKKKQKKSKELNLTQEVLDSQEVEKAAEIAVDKPSELPDPGWDWNCTSISLPKWNKTSIWSEDEDEEEDATKDQKRHVSKSAAKKLTAAEDEAAARLEQRVMDGEVAAPETTEEFERLVMGSPDSSLCWIQFMAHHMQTCEYDLARAVAKRALERINFREEGERLNIFLAWLNLENSFGSEDTLEVVLKEALQCNDQFKVYSQMAAIYAQSGKIKEAEKIFKTMVRKFNKEKDVWIKYGIFYFKNNKLNDGRFVLQRSLQSLDKKDHLDITSKFAQIEFRYGDPERGKTMFETILGNYPKRTDLWSVYVDQLVKTGDNEAARALYRRISTLGLQAKRMKFLFKKWLDFEAVHGCAEGEAEVKQMALKYLQDRVGPEES